MSSILSKKIIIIGGVLIILVLIGSLALVLLPQAKNFYSQTAKVTPVVTASPTITPLVTSVSSVLSSPPPMPSPPLNPQQLKAIQDAAYKAPGDAVAQVQLGVGYIADYRYNEAVTVLENAVALDQNNKDAKVALGVAYCQIGQLDKAKQQYEQVKTYQSFPVGLLSNMIQRNCLVPSSPSPTPKSSVPLK